MSELLSLKALLTSWGLPELFAQFQDESIDIEELKMMKSQHITEFLRSHKLGTRIRFEYHFERWRRDQNKPLTDPVMPNCTHTHYACSTPSHTTDLLRPEARESTVASNKNLQTRATNTAAVSCVSVATNTTAELTFKAPRLDKTPTPPPPPPLPPPLSIQLPPQPPPAPLPTISPKLSPPKVLPSAPLPPLSKPSSPTPLPAIKNSLREMPRRSVRQVSSSVLEVSGMVEIPKAFLLSPTTTTSTTTATTTTATAMTAPTTTTPAVTTTSTSNGRRFSVPFTDDPDDEHLDNGPILHIINSSGAKGQSLLDYYAQHKKFTNTQRSLLIQLIVNFFDMHEYHLSLKLSHNLEEQILRLFPSEKLHYYRTEKRGKIYVKFCNMKRYKRDRPAAKRRCLDAEDGAVENGGGADGEAADGGMVMEPEVGIECDDDEDDNVDFISWQQLMQQPEGEVQVKTEMLGESDYQ